VTVFSEPFPHPATITQTLKLKAAKAVRMESSPQVWRQHRPAWGRKQWGATRVRNDL
jgi:hypothetical protein